MAQYTEAQEKRIHADLAAIHKSQARREAREDGNFGG
jgi:hypothetical protein